MENGRDDKIRRRALALWEQAGQRGVMLDYLEAAENDIDAEYEHAPDEPERSGGHAETAAETADFEVTRDGTVLRAGIR